MTSDEARAKAENCITLVEWYGLTGDGAAIRQVLDEHAALRQRVADLERDHVSREDRERALDEVEEAGWATPRARRLLKLDGEGA